MKQRTEVPTTGDTCSATSMLVDNGIYTYYTKTNKCCIPSKYAVVGTNFIALQAWHMAQTGAFIDGRLNVYTHRL